MITATCGSCQTELDEATANEPCPACGEVLKRGVTVAVPPAAIAVAALPPTLSAGYGPARWTTRWQDMTESLVALRLLDAGGAQATQTMHAKKLETYFLDCLHLFDSLIEDDQLSPRMTKDQLWQHHNQSSALQIAFGFGNTSKHIVRNGTKGRHKMAPITARIEEVVLGPLGGRRFKIGYWSTTVQPAEHIDGLTMVEQSYAAWQMFLADNHIDEPASIVTLRT